MSQIEPNPNGPAMVSDQQLVLLVYLLYLAAYIFGITVRTFWIGLLYLVVGGFLAYASYLVVNLVTNTKHERPARAEREQAY